MDILVYADWVGLQAPTLMGTLSVTHTRGHGVFMFAYEKTWIDKGIAQQLDPDLQFFTGPQYLGDPKNNFGLFLDSSPDRWGRVLMDRREAIMARQERRKPKKLFEEDYLLGVYDAHRMGALRFKLEATGRFLNDQSGLATPPMTSLRELEQASLRLERNDLKETEILKWLNLLLAPGASLGGARPKASVTDEKGQPWIAKFPSIKDKTDIGAWEMVVNEMARKAGVQIAGGMLKKYNSEQHTFLSKRFDRTTGNRRLHFASAMTLLGQSDGATGISYLDLAGFITQQGAAARRDLEELWRRIVFNILVKNTDDHLRNHGFLLKDKGWELSPAYDVNPVYFGQALTLNISETDNSLDIELAKSVARHFRVSSPKANEIIGEVKKAVKGWQKLAAKYHIKKAEQDLMAGAFEGVES